MSEPVRYASNKELNALVAAIIGAIRRADIGVQTADEPARHSFISRCMLAFTALLARYADRIEKAQKAAVAILILVVTLAALVYAYVGWRPVTVIDTISTPDDFAKKGFTPITTQRKFEEYVTDILNSASSVMPTEIHEQMQEDGQQEVSIPIPGAGISLQETLATAKALLGRDGRISAELVEEGDQLVLSGRTTRPGGSARPFRALGVSAGIDQVIKNGAAEAMKLYSPYLLASANLDAAQKACDAGHCDFTDVKNAFVGILQSPSVDDKQFAPWAHLGLSKIAEDEGDFEREIEESRLAIRLKPHFSWASYNWGVALERRKCLRHAEEKFHDVVKYRDSFAAGHNAYGRLLLASAQAIARRSPAGELERNAQRDLAREAEQQFQRATSLDPQYAEAFVNYGIALRLQGDYDAALDKLRWAAAIDPQHPAWTYAEIATTESLRDSQDPSDLVQTKISDKQQWSAWCQSAAMNKAPDVSEVGNTAGDCSTMTDAIAMPEQDPAYCQSLASEN